MMIRSPFLALGLLASSGLKQRGPDEASAGASKRSSHLEFGSFSGLVPCGRNLPERRFEPLSEWPTIRLERPFSVSGLRIRYDVSWTGRLRYASDSDDSNFTARGPDEPFYVVRIACENRSFLPNGCSHNNGVNDIRRFGHA